MKGIKDKKDNELTKALAEKKKAIRLFRFSLAGGKAKNVKEGVKIRKEIAQILTEMNVRKNTNVSG